MKVLVSHPTGSQFVRHTLRALEDAGLLHEFWTSIARHDRQATDVLLPKRLVSELRRRAYDADILVKTQAIPFREVVRLAAIRFKIGSAFERENSPFSLDRIYRHQDSVVAKRVARGGVDAVFAYEDGALRTYQTARERGISRIYEHPVGYWRHFQRIMQEEKELVPEYSGVMGGIRDSEEKRLRKDQEIELADLVVVPSHFSARTLEEFPGPAPDIATVNYGAPAVAIGQPKESGSGKIRVLFVGSLQQRKGISYFVEAMRLAGQCVTVTVVGSRVGECKPVDDFLAEVEWIPSAPHAHVLEIMGRCDVLVLPSLSEGFGLVVLEAMSQGLTVIVSENTGAADVVDQGTNGFVVPIRSSPAIAEKIVQLHSDSALLLEMKTAALKTAREHTWAVYREKLLNSISVALQGKEAA